MLIAVHGLKAELNTSGSDAQPLVTVAGGHSALVGKAVALQVKVGEGEIILLGSIPSEETWRR